MTRSAVRRDGPSQVRVSDHTDAATVSAATNHTQRIVYSKYGPKMRLIDTTASTHTAASSPCNRSSSSARRRHADRAPTPHSTTMPARPTAAIKSNDSRAAPSTHGPSRLSCRAAISATRPSPRPGSFGEPKWSMRIDRLPGSRRSWSTIGGIHAITATSNATITHSTSARRRSLRQNRQTAPTSARPSTPSITSA
ncbi:MAG: hypothetical protein MUE78_08570 [Ilumatobacteraceae bacterium]|nr:hypothetical protein [Ilumatobacteraceae bacterium]